MRGVRIADIGLFRKRSVCRILVMLLWFISEICSQLTAISTVQVVFCSFQAHSFAPLLTAFVCQKIGNLEALKF